MKRLLAMFLAVVMLVTNCPVTAFATDTEILESGNFQDNTAALDAAATQTEPKETVPVEPEETVPETTGETLPAEEPEQTEAVTQHEETLESKNLAASQQVEETGVEFTYNVLNETQCAVTGYTGTDTEIVIPAELDGYQVHTIASGSFRNKTALTSVTLPNSLRKIEAAAFENCAALKSITIPSGVTTVMEYTFSGCTSLAEVNLPDGLELIKDYAFANCKALTYIDLPDSITELYRDAFRDCTALAEIGYPAGLVTVTMQNYYRTPFYGCSALKRITVDEGVTVIPAHAFRDMTGLEEIVLPESISSIGAYAFENCTNLKKINLTKNMTAIGDHVFMNCEGLEEIVIPENITSIATSAFEGCESLKSITIPSGVTTVMEYTFSGCTSLAEVNLPDGLELIEGYAFQNCKALTYIDLPDSITELYRDAFRDCTALAEIGYPAGLVTVNMQNYYRTPFYGCTALKRITVDEGVTVIPAHTFRSMTSLEEIVLPESISSIGAYAFENCTSLKKINLTKNMTAIGDHVFMNCEGLEEIVIPENITSIAASAFEGCESLKSITIPSGVTTVMEYTFSGCTSLAEVNLPDGLELIKDYAFANCKALTYIDLPDSITELYRDAFRDCTALAEIGYPAGLVTVNMQNYYRTPFYGCTALKRITVDEGVTVIPAHTFRDMTGLEEIVLPESVSSIGAYAFENCTNLKKINLTKNMTAIGDHVFMNCEGLEEIVIPENITSIAASAFEGCESLRSITIPSGVTAVMEYTFSGCTSLAEVNLPDGLELIKDYAFANCKALTYIDLPDSITELYRDAFRDCTALAEIGYPAGLVTVNMQNYYRSPFYGCTALKCITVDEGVTVIPAHTFRSMTGLEEIVLPESISSIGAYAFENCTNLKKINLTKNMTAIGDHVFMNCEGLEEIVIPENITSIAASAFEGCESLRSITIPSGVTAVMEYTFSGCTSLAEVNLPDGLELIEGYAFANCKALTYIDLPDSITELYRDAFRDCTALAEIGYPAGLVTVNTHNYYRSPFHGCTALKRITVDEGVTVIPAHTFRDMTGLESITLPGSLTTIGNYAWEGCTALKALEIPRSVTEIPANSLESCSKELVIYCYNASAAHYAFENSGYTLYFLDDHQHSFYTETQAEPTCVQAGSTKSTCSVCGYYYIEIQQSTGHSFGSWRLAQESSCERGGSQYRTCRICGAEETRRLAANGHDYREEVVPATCTARGCTVHTCTVCGDAYADSYVNALSHSFTGWSVTVDATVLQKGLRSRTCTVCGWEETEELPKIAVDVAENENYGLANFLVMDAINLVPVSGASIFISTPKDGEATLITDENGKVSQILPVGTWSASVCADGFVVRNITITVSAGVQEIPPIGISDRPMVDAKITVEEMTYEEMIAAGIDVGNKDNRHYYKWKCEIRFHEELDIQAMFPPVYKDDLGNTYATASGPDSKNFFALSHQGEAVTKEHVTVYYSDEYGTYIKHRSSYENAIWTPEMGEAMTFRNNGYYFEGYGLPSQLTMTTQRVFPNAGWSLQSGTIAMKVGSRTHYLTYQEDEFRTVSSTAEVKSIGLFEQVKVENENYPTTAEFVYVPVNEVKADGKYLLVQLDTARIKTREALAHEENEPADVKMRIHRDDVLGEYITVEEKYQNAYWATSYAAKGGLRIVNNQYFGYADEKLTFAPLAGADGWTLDEDGRLCTTNSKGETVYLMHAGDYVVVTAKELASAVTLYKKTTVQDLVDGSGRMEEKIIYRPTETFEEGEEYVIFGGSSGSGGGGGGANNGGGGPTHDVSGTGSVHHGQGMDAPVIHQITEQYYLIIYGEVSWLKEMFEVELLVLNNSGLDPITNCTAYLNLPEGLSLATMVEGQQSMIQTIENIPAGGRHSFRWFIRGDDAGAYNIGATLTGQLGELESFSYYYETQDPIQVLAGSALKLTFNIPDVAYKEKPYVVTIELQNVSNKVLYNVDHMITGWEQGKIHIYEDGKEEIVKKYGSGDYMGNAGVHAFYPGDKLVVELSFEILFESSLVKQMLKDLEQIEGLYQIYEIISAAQGLLSGLSGFVSTTSGALDSIINAQNLTDTVKLEALGELLGALRDLYGIFEKGDSEALEMADDIQSTDFFKELSSFASQEELEEFFLAQDVSIILDIANKIKSTLSGETDTDSPKKFDTFDSIRTLISNLPIRYVVDAAWVETMDGSTTVIPHEIKMVPGGQNPKMGVESWSKYIYNTMIASMGKIESPVWAQALGAPDDLTGYEDAVAYVKQTEDQTAAYSVHKSAYTNFSAWVERADGTIADPDWYKVATANETASYSEDGKLNFAGNAIVEVTALSRAATARSVGYDILHIRDNDTGDVTKIAIDVMPAHTCQSSDWTVDVAPNENHAGYRSKYCDVCADTIAMEALTYCGAHVFGEWVVEQHATTQTMGIQSRTCENCFAKETTFLPVADVETYGYELAAEPSPAVIGEAVTLTFRLTDYAETKSGIREFRIDLGDVDDVLHNAVCTTLVTDTENVSVNAAMYQENIDAVRYDFVKQSGVLSYENSDLLEVQFTVPEHYTEAGTLSLPVQIHILNEDGDTVTYENTATICYVPEDGSDIGDPNGIEIALSQEYISLPVGQSYQLTAEVLPGELASRLQWDVEGDGRAFIDLDDDGNVTGRAEGTAYVIAMITTGGENKVTARCRIDVVESAQIDIIQLSTTKVTTELYSTNYAEFEILLQLPQNLAPASRSTYSLRDLNNKGVAMVDAWFTDATMDALFDLQVLDDRRVLVVPTGPAIEQALENSRSVKSSYSSTISVAVAGRENPVVTAEKLTLSVKQTKPKLTGKIASFNSFYTGQSQEITLSGGTVVMDGISLDTTKKNPNWLNLEENSLILNKNAPAKSASAKVYLRVETEEWAIPAQVTLSVKNAYKKPSLKLSASTVTMLNNALLSDGISLTLMCGSKTDTLEKLNVSSIAVAANDAAYYSTSPINPDGTFLLTAAEGFKAGKINLEVSFGDTTDSIVTLPLTVKTAAVTLKRDKSSITLNQALKDQAVITITATPADYTVNLTEEDFRLADSKGATLAEEDQDILDIEAKDNRITVATNANTPAKGTYRIYVKAGGSKEVYTTITVVNKTPTVTFKATGTLDLSFPNNAVTLTPSFKNYIGGTYSVDSWSVVEKKGSKVIKEDVSDYFRLDEETMTLSWKEEHFADLTSGNTYEVTLKLNVPGVAKPVTSMISLTMKRTVIKLKLGASSISLNKLLGDAADVSVSCVTSGYDFTGPVMELWDSKGKTKLDSGAELTNNGKLCVTWDDGQIHIELDEYANYRDSFQIKLKANEYSSAYTIKVTIPAEDKSKVTVSLKAVGSIDVIRSSTQIVLTPGYKNCMAGKDWEEEFWVYTSESKYKTPIPAKELFDIREENGTHILTAKEGLNPKLKYKVQMVSKLGELEYPSPLVSISVKAGSANVTMTATGTTLFAKDKYDRAEVIFTAKDETLNQVTGIAIKDSKYQNLLEIIEYGNGEFAIGFANGIADSSIQGKTITLTLNVFVEGNDAAAVTTAKLKLTVLK